MAFINCTPHDIFVRTEKETFRYEKSQNPARVAQTLVSIGNYVGFPTYVETFGEIENLPSPKKGIWLIVSRVVAEAAEVFGRSRWDLLVPVNFDRDENGRITGCRGFAVVEPPTEFFK